MNRYSKKRQKLNREYSKLAKAFKEAHPICQAQTIYCEGVTSDVHHKKGKVGKNYLDESTWLAVCRQCHYWIEKNPKWAKEKGFSQSRLTA